MGEGSKSIGKSVLYSKAVSVPCGVAVLLRAVSVTERKSDLQNGAGRNDKL